LHRVAEERGGPAFGQPPKAVFLQGDFESVEHVPVLVRVDLDATLDKIQGYDGGVCDTTRQDTLNVPELVILWGQGTGEVPPMPHRAK
jgi:hypothetical protein